MKIVVISGSSRANSQSRKVANVLMHKLYKKEVEHAVLDLHEVQLPVYNGKKQEKWLEIAPFLESADGFVWIAPEWNGSVAPALPNLLTYASTKVKPFAHKPVLLVGVSSGAGGAYPIAQLHAYGNKNNFAVFTPDQLRFRGVESIFNANEPEDGNEVDEAMHDRTDYALTTLIAYAEKLKSIRSSGILRLEDFSNGN